MKRFKFKGIDLIFLVLLVLTVLVTACDGAEPIHIDNLIKTEVAIAMQEYKKEEQNKKNYGPIYLPSTPPSWYQTKSTEKRYLIGNKWLKCTEHYTSACVNLVCNNVSMLCATNVKYKYVISDGENK